jgi:hypothetical protein
MSETRRLPLRLSPLYADEDGDAAECVKEIFRDKQNQAY